MRASAQAAACLPNTDLLGVTRSCRLIGRPQVPVAACAPCSLLHRWARGGRAPMMATPALAMATSMGPSAASAAATAACTCSVPKQQPAGGLACVMCGSQLQKRAASSSV